MKILFVYTDFNSFVEKDLNIMRERFYVREVVFKGLGDILELVRGVIWADLTFSWFGKLHAFCAIFFSKIFGKKSIVVAGGDDVAYVPKIKYGMFSFWWKKWCPLFVFRYADSIISVSEFNKGEVLASVKTDSIKVNMIYHGFCYSIFKNAGAKKQNIVITIGSISNENRTKKGLDLFIETARLLQDVPFILIGPDVNGALEPLKRKATSNLKFFGGIYGRDLIDICSRAKVYVQASIHESFGCSLAEAMLCECIPVVSRNAAIPEVVGDTGIYVDRLTPEELSEKIRYALNLPDEYGKKARNRIIEKFPLNRRKQQIIELVEKLYAGS